MLIQQKNTDTDNQYILYQYGNDITEKTKIIKKDSNIRKILTDLTGNIDYTKVKNMRSIYAQSMRK